MIYRCRVDLHRLSQIILVLGLSFASVTLPASGQSRRSSTNGVISGRITTEDGRPVEGASVQLGGAASRSTMTDAEGNFSFTGLAPLAYRIYANAPAYVNATDLAGESPFVRVGESVNINLVKGGVITGRVTDTSDEPVVGVAVWAVRLRDVEGRLVKNQYGVRMRVTDDRGIYRLYGLQAGSYFVIVNPTSADSFRTTSYDQETPTYYPSSPREGASEVALQAGVEASGIDIRYRRTRGHAISGPVEGATSTNDFGILVELRAGGNVVTTVNPRPTPEGRIFYFEGVPDGDYDLVARVAPGQDEGWISNPRRVRVRGADLTGITLTVLPMGSISGKAVLESATLPEGCRRGRESLLIETYIQTRREERGEDPEATGITGYRSGVAVKEGGDFAIRYLMAGQYRLEPDLPGDNWYVKALTMPAATTTGRIVDLGRSGLRLKVGEKLTGVVMTLGEGAASIAGKLEAEKINRGARYRVHLVPVETAQDDQQLRYYETVAEADGRFSLTHLAPGKYWILAKAIPEDQSLERSLEPVAGDVTERAKLRREAETAKQEIELKTCQQLKDHALKLR
jgi:hypothetical protein